jgi:hypothetical protein
MTEDLLDWAVERWKAEVEHRPLNNVHRRTLDDTWRQVIRKLGGDDVALIGKCHDDLIDEARSTRMEMTEAVALLRHLTALTVHHLSQSPDLQDDAVIDIGEEALRAGTTANVESFNGLKTAVHEFLKFADIRKMSGYQFSPQLEKVIAISKDTLKKVEHIGQ